VSNALFSEELYSLAQAAKLLPRNHNGKHTSIQTLRRWATRGSRGVRLEVTKVGSRAYVTLEALRAFIQARSQRPIAPMQVSPTKAARRATEALRRMGV